MRISLAKEEEIEREAFRDREAYEAYHRNHEVETSRQRQRRPSKPAEVQQPVHLRSGEVDYDKCLAGIADAISKSAPSVVIATAFASVYPDELLEAAYRQYKKRRALGSFFTALIYGPSEWWGPSGFKAEVIAKMFTYGDLAQFISIVKKHKTNIRTTSMLILPCWDDFWKFGILHPLAHRPPDYLKAWELLQKSRRGIRLSDGIRTCMMSIKGFHVAVGELFQSMKNAGLVGVNIPNVSIYDSKSGWNLIRKLESETGGCSFHLTRYRREFLQMYAYFQTREKAKPNKGSRNHNNPPAVLH